MATREEKVLEGLKIDPLHKFLAEQFRRFTDSRDENQSITMQDALMSGYALFSLKDPSLLQFNNERTLYATATGQAEPGRKPKGDIQSK